MNRSPRVFEGVWRRCCKEHDFAMELKHGQAREQRLKWMRVLVKMFKLPDDGTDLLQEILR